MPRNLTDLMEAAVSAAPPEPHHASDITRLAERHQRRRTAFVAGATAVAVIAVAGGAFGLTRGRAATPEPADSFLHDQTVDASSAVPASSLPGYRLEPWTIPSVQQFGHGRGPAATYRGIDADGRLIVGDYPGGVDTPARSRLFGGPGQAARPLAQPPSTGGNSRHQIGWVPSFQADGRLLWTIGPIERLGISAAPNLSPASVGFHLTDLDGGHDVFVHTHFRLDGNVTDDVTRPWVSDDHLWFTSYDSGTAQGNSLSLYTAAFSGSLTKVADKVAVAAVADGVAAWVTTDGTLVTESATGGPQHTVTVPLTPGCRMASTSELQNTGANSLAVSRSVIALTESCGTGDAALQQIVAFDPGGHLLVHVTGLFSFNPTLGHNDLVFQGLVPSGFEKEASFRYDLVTGALAGLSPVAEYRSLAYPQAAGDYVLWYDKNGGQVAEFTG